jgi:hypothetical protein
VPVRSSLRPEGPGATPTRITTRGLLAASGYLAAPAAIAVLAFIFPTAGTVGLAVSAGLALLVVAYLVVVASATLLFTGVLVMQIFSGNWQYLGLPIGLDRLLFAAALLALARDWWARRLPGVPIRLTAAHGFLMVLMTWALLSALFAGTLVTTNGFFALLDRLGFVPFFAFFLAPRLYGHPSQRRTLLIGLVGVGAYLGVLSFAEGLGLDPLVQPAYILDQNIGIHADRARGPFLEAVAMGFALLTCAITSLVASHEWRNGTGRRLAVGVAVVCGLGTIFTLTRAVWLGAVLAVLAAAVVTPALRRWILPGAAAAVLLVVVLLTLVPGLSDSVGERAGSQRPLWDRYNSNIAAVNIVQAEPLTGVGWQRFTEVSDDWTEQAEGYPVTGVGIEVHNVFLSHASELGLPGAALYLCAWVAAVLPPILARGGATHRPWRRALVGIAVVWLVVASFGPLSYAFANTVLWLFAGIASVTARDTAVSAPAREEVPA